nr:MAG TPA: hypothetical protein [Caudoviricetes sp.]
MTVCNRQAVFFIPFLPFYRWRVLNEIAKEMILWH